MNEFFGIEHFANKPKFAFGINNFFTSRFGLSEGSLFITLFLSRVMTGNEKSIFAQKKKIGIMKITLILF